MTAFKKIIDLNTKLKIFFAKKIVNFDFKINDNSKNIKSNLIKVLL